MTFASTYIISLLHLLVFCGPAQTNVSVRVSPERSQFFKYESISLSCEEEGTSMLGWSVKRQSRERGAGTCNFEWGTRTTKGASCVMEVYRWDSGMYWCQSKAGELSRPINITVSDGAVILESPVLPVMEESNVTLRCWSKDNTTDNPSSDRPADFYKDGSLIRTESTGQMTIHSVSKSDEGFYKCHFSDVGESPESWMDVRDSTSSAPPLMSLPHLIIHILAVILYLVSTVLLVYIHRERARAAANVERRDNVIMEVAV